MKCEECPDRLFRRDKVGRTKYITRAEPTSPANIKRTKQITRVYRHMHLLCGRHRRWAGGAKGAIRMAKRTGHISVRLPAEAKTEVVTARVSPEIRDALKIEAAREHRSISQQIAMILDAHVHTLQDRAGKKEMIAPIGYGVLIGQSAPCAPGL